MVAVHLLTRDSLLKNLSPYGCKFVQSFPIGFEIWETGWGYAFTLRPEGALYSFQDYQHILSAVIAATMPDNWTTP